MKKQYVSLHNHTELGSPLDGLNTVQDLFGRAKELEMPAVAVTDHGTMTALYDSYKESKKTGIKLVPGCEFYFSTDLTEKKSNHMVLLAKNEIGYKNLLRLNYEAYNNQVRTYMTKFTPRITWEHIQEYNEGVVCLTACANGLLSKTIMNGDEKLAIEYMQRLKHIFDGNFYLELQPHCLKTSDGKVDQLHVNQTLLRYSHDYDIPYVITCDAHYRDKEHAKYHDFMLAIKDQKAVDDPERFRYGVEDMYLKSSDELMDFFGKDVAEKGIDNSMKILQMCDEPDYIKPKGPMLPTFPVSYQEDYKDFLDWKKDSDPNVPEDKAYLRYKCIEGFREKFENASNEDKEKYWDRVKAELSILESKNFSSYMLIVSDYMTWARKNMPCGPARGSAAGSLVAFLTKITTIDPLKYDLMFERFQNSEKKSFPDIDSDFSRPDLVKDYIKNKYGVSKVASISNWSTMSPKVAIKDVARSLRIGGDKSTAFEISNHITSIMPDSDTVKDACAESKEFSKLMAKYPDLYKYASKLEGITRNWGVHAAGIVIGDRPLYEVAPLRVDPRDGLVVTQWEKERCEENGLIKMDLLGLNTLTFMENCIQIIKETTGDVIVIDEIDLNDKETYSMLGRGETAGVFQLESSLTPLCMKIRPKNVEEISAINALGRPSCNPETRMQYINASTGEEAVRYYHPTMQRALGKTFGVLLYEESSMAIAQDCAGWDLNQADALRKITKLKGKDPELVLKTEAKFIQDCMKFSQMTYEQASHIWTNFLEPLGLYGFNKSHSISYSHTSYHTAWLRCHYPVQFMCALLNSEDANSDKSQEYINECKKMGITVTPPLINSSKRGYSVVGKDRIATGLEAIKGCGEKALDEVLSLQPFSSIKDFLFRTNARVVNKGIVQSLARAGAFNELGAVGKDIHDNYASYRTKLNAGYDSYVKKNNSDVGFTVDGVNLNFSKEEWDHNTILMNEKDVLGRTISGSLHEVFDSFFSKNSSIVTRLDMVPQLRSGIKVKVEAIVNSQIKEFKIKNGPNIGKKFAKYLIEDIHGNTAEMTIWNTEYEQLKTVLKDGIPIKCICRVSEYMGKKDLSLAVMERVYGQA